jgi:hypothetical protein
MTWTYLFRTKRAFLIRLLLVVHEQRPILLFPWFDEDIHHVNIPMDDALLRLAQNFDTSTFM